MQRPPNAGRPQALSQWLGSTDIAFLANILSPYFLPNGATSGTTASQGKLQDAATIVLGSGGTLSWSFKTAFTIPPAVTATPQKTAGSSSTGTLEVQTVTKAGCTVKSSDSGDTRLVHLQAVQPSQGD